MLGIPTVEGEMANLKPNHYLGSFFQDLARIRERNAQRRSSHEYRPASGKTIRCLASIRRLTWRSPSSPGGLCRIRFNCRSAFDVQAEYP